MTNEMMIRKTTVEDIPRLMEIFALARAFMRETGNRNQWADDYPSRECLEEDIKRGDSYVCVKDGMDSTSAPTIEATFVLREGNDPTYDKIYDGAWTADCEYATIHRIASSGRLHGIFSDVMAFALKNHRSVRIDTHRDNKVMQHCIEKAGFQYCGIIYCWNGAERLAYQYVAQSPAVKRCRWCNMNNPLYIRYHDEEWGVPLHDERRLFEMLILEGFQAGLSWECVLNKREAFRKAFDDFDYQKVKDYDVNSADSQSKIESLKNNPGIIRNGLKIKAAISNAKVFIEIQKEFGSFDSYIWSFTDGRTIYEPHRDNSPLSDRISKDLRKRGMKFVGTTIIYAYLEAIGILNTHEEGCFLHRGR